MRSRLLLLLPALALPIASVSCSWSEDAIVRPDPTPIPAQPAQPALKAPAAPPAAAPASPPAASASVSVVSAPDPGLLTTLPPELVDDGSDDVKDTEPAPPPAAPGREVPELAATGKETWVYAEPRWKARRIGYLRAGAVVERRAEPVVRNHACPEGWYRIEPRGYVCAGDRATLDVFDPVVETSAKRPRRDGFPYTYVMSRSPPPPFYARLPSAAEALAAEPDLKGHLRRTASVALEPGYVEPPPAEPIPGALLYGQAVPPLGGEKRAHGALVIGHAKARSGFALLSTFDHEGRRYGLTTELAVLPLDRARVIKPSTFHGIKLDGEVTLPVVFVKSHHATRWVTAPGGGIVRGEPIGFREAVPITGAERRIGGEGYFVATDGSFIPSAQAVRVDRAQRPPAWAAEERRWIDISIVRQSLVAYEGKRPVYATLVSTGADGLGDPKKTHSTIRGAFLIHTKHISVTMDDDRIGDEFDFRDVPFVQYFTEGFALHGAYWHDDFGTPRSHGCVNLAPTDAAWLFNWTDPEVPPAWHGALSLRRGTLVYIHP
jgi:lipoprotein-anchoring transpeptidase ErfK/SrfK